MEKRDVIYDSRADKYYWDNGGMIRNFETVVKKNVTWEKANELYPNVIEI